MKILLYKLIEKANCNSQDVHGSFQLLILYLYFFKKICMPFFPTIGDPPCNNMVVISD